jgi:truncated hemoglobin YjbI
VRKARSLLNPLGQEMADRWAADLQMAIRRLDHAGLDMSPITL